MRAEHKGNLTIELSRKGPSEKDIRDIARTMGYQIGTLGVTHSANRSLRCVVEWRDDVGANRVPPLIERLAQQEGVLCVNWEPLDAGQVDE